MGEEGGGAEDVGARWAGWPEVVGDGAGFGWADGRGGEAKVVVFRVGVDGGEGVGDVEPWRGACYACGDAEGDGFAVERDVGGAVVEESED